MKRFYTGQEWFDRLFPEGVPIPSSTLLSGPGGSGKPLVGNVIAAAWLRQGGSVVFMSLQYPSPEFVIVSMKQITGLDLADYQDRTAFIDLDATLDGMSDVEGNRFRANVAIPSVWDAALERGCGMVPSAGPGILVLGSALNLLLFSRTYAAELLDRMIAIARGPSEYTYLFSTSTTAKADEIARIEAATDNLILVRGDWSTRRLYLRVVRVKDTPFEAGEIQVPFPEEALVEVKKVADHSRQRVIPQISRL